jgi:3-hydroxybutyryl-CoA dehydrogenase
MNAHSYNSASVDLGSIVVVGGGTMGRGIAALCALSGCSTRIYEADESARRVVRSAIESSWRRGMEKGRLAPDAAAQAAQRLDVVDHLEFPDDCGFVLEAVPEQLELKQRLFAEIDQGAPAAAILASNTSSLSIASIARSTGRPDRVIGIHFFNPVAVMPLVEIVRGPETSSETESRATAFVAALGKQAVRVRDSPGFATSRLETLARELDPVRFRPPEQLKRMVAAGRTGKKSGRGFYRWEGETPIAALEETPEEKT